MKSAKLMDRTADLKNVTGDKASMQNKDRSALNSGRPSAQSKTIGSPIASRAPSVQVNENVHNATSRKSSLPASPLAEVTSNGPADRKKFVAMPRESRVGRSTGMATESAVENMLSKIMITMSPGREENPQMSAMSERVSLIDQVPKHASHASSRTHKFVKFLPNKVTPR